MKKITIILLFSIALLGSVFTQVPQTLSYQGILTDTEGNIVPDGYYYISLTLYDADTNGTNLWTATDGIEVVDGIFNYIIGSTIPLYLPFDQQYWLGIAIDGGDELIPRTELTSSAYSLNTRNIPDSIVTGKKVADGNLVRSINTLTDDITLSAGSNVSITETGNILTISASGSGGDFTLPYSGSTSATGNAFDITHTGSGSAGFFEIDNSSSLYTALVCKTNGTTSAISGYTIGIGMAGEFRINNASNVNYAVSAVTNGMGDAGYFSIINSDNTNEAVHASTTGSGTALYGYSTGMGNAASCEINNASNDQPVMLVTTNGSGGVGVSGRATNINSVVSYGGKFISDGKYGYGVAGIAEGTYGIGVYGYAPSTNFAGRFEGNVRVTEDLHVSGTLTKAAGSFKIDHPLDPQNKNLYHSFVESPDMKNIYDGNITTDGNGNAIIELPEWFEALNKDFRYQLTVIGEFAQAIVSQKIINNRFSIKTDKPNIEVSWQVTGIRQDAFANANRIPVEEIKNPEDKGKYLHPEAFGLSKTMGVDYDEKFEQERIRMKQQGLERERMRVVEEKKYEQERVHMEEQKTEIKRN